MQRFLDISMSIENGVPSDPPGYEFQVDYIGHADTVPMLQNRYEGLQAADLIGGEAFALESVQLSTHNGTHVDAPWHYSSTMADGTREPHHRPDAARLVLPPRREARPPLTSPTATSFSPPTSTASWTASAMSCSRSTSSW